MSKSIPSNDVQFIDLSGVPIAATDGLAVLSDAVRQVTRCRTYPELVVLMQKRGARWRRLLDRKEWSVLTLHVKEHGSRIRAEIDRQTVSCKGS